MKSLLIVLAAMLFAVQQPQRVASVTQKRPLITLDSVISISEPGPSAYEEVLNAGIDNKLPLGLVIDGKHRLCTYLAVGGQRKLKLADFINQIDTEIPGYKASFQDGTLNVFPEELSGPVTNLLKLRVPEFHSGPDTHQGLGVNLWMFIRALIAPGEGTGFVGGSSTTRETISGMTVRAESVKTILNSIVEKGGGGAWVLHSSAVKDLSPSTPKPYDVYGYLNEEQSLRNINCSGN